MKRAYVQVHVCHPLCPRNTITKHKLEMGIITGLTETVDQTKLSMRVDRLPLVSLEGQLLRGQDVLYIIPNTFIQDDMHPPTGGSSNRAVRDVVFDPGSTKLLHSANEGTDRRSRESCLAKGIADLKKGGAAIVIE